MPINDEKKDYDDSQSSETVVTSLTIKNLTFSDISEVRWNGITFKTEDSDDTIKLGDYVKRNVQEGYGYVYFKRKSNPLFARTKAIVTVNAGEQFEFVLTDNTLVVEQHNINNIGKFSDLDSTVVFYDDAEGDLQQYDLLYGDVSYYSDGGYNKYGAFVKHFPKNGNNSIGIAGSSSITLNVNLDHEAILSFWYATTQGLKFYINDELLIDIDGECSWSHKEIELPEGSYTLEWKGIYSNSSFYSSLDDILILCTK